MMLLNRDEPGRRSKLEKVSESPVKDRGPVSVVTAGMSLDGGVDGCLSVTVHSCTCIPYCTYASPGSELLVEAWQVVVCANTLEPRKWDSPCLHMSEPPIL